MERPDGQARPGETLRLRLSGGYVAFNNARFCGDDVVGYVYSDHLPKEFTKRFSNIPWVDVVGFRNIAVHEYFAIRWEIAWVAATEEVPVLKEQIEKILQEEFQD